MPSPVGHSSIALLVWALLARLPSFGEVVRRRPGPFYVLVIVALGVPDIDFLLRQIGDQRVFGHGGVTHSLAFGVAFGVLFAVLCRWIYGSALPFWPALAIGTGGVWSHVLMDMATWRTRGILLFWPFSLEGYSTVPLFYGARHSQPWAWRLHLITLSTELAFAAAVWLFAMATLPNRYSRLTEHRQPPNEAAGSGEAQEISEAKTA